MALSQVNAAAGTSFKTPGYLKDWLDDGADLEGHVLPTIRTVKARINGTPIRSLRYFDAEIRAAMRAEPLKAVSADDTAKYEHAARWRLAEKVYRDQHLNPDERERAPTPDEAAAMIRAEGFYSLKGYGPKTVLTGAHREQALGAEGMYCLEAEIRGLDL